MGILSWLTADLLQPALKSAIKEGLRRQSLELKVGPEQTTQAVNNLTEVALDDFVSQAMDPSNTQVKVTAASGV